MRAYVCARVQTCDGAYVRVLSRKTTHRSESIQRKPAIRRGLGAVCADSARNTPLRKARDHMGAVTAEVVSADTPSPAAPPRFDGCTACAVTPGLPSPPKVISMRKSQPVKASNVQYVPPVTICPTPVADDDNATAAADADDVDRIDGVKTSRPEISE